jgi:hypothetical protein
MARGTLILFVLAVGAAAAFACSSSSGGNGSPDGGSGVTFACTVGGGICTQIVGPASSMSGEQNACAMQMGTFAVAACPTAGSFGCCKDANGIEMQCAYDPMDQQVLQGLCTNGKTWIPTEAGSGGMGPMAFVGTWMRSGTQTVMCPGGTTMNMIAGNLVITLGSTSDGIVGTTPNGCVTSYSVVGTTASAMAGQTCNVTTEGGIAETITVISHTLMLSPDGKTLASMSSETIDKTAMMVTCMGTSTGNYAKQ